VGLIDLLEEGDHVVADRGFTVRDLLPKKGVKLNIPPFTKGNPSTETESGAGHVVLKRK